MHVVRVQDRPMHLQGSGHAPPLLPSSPPPLSPSSYPPLYLLQCFIVVVSLSTGRMMHQCDKHYGEAHKVYIFICWFLKFVHRYMLFCVWRYADLLTSFLRPHGRILLEHHLYLEDPGPHREAPSHLPDEMVHELYGSAFDIEKLESETWPSESTAPEMTKETDLMTLKVIDSWKYVPNLQVFIKEIEVQT